MKRSGDRILCTHTGSLPWPDDQLAMLQAKDAGQLGDLTPFRARVRVAVAEVVRQKAELGLGFARRWWGQSWALWWRVGSVVARFGAS